MRCRRISALLLRCSHLSKTVSETNKYAHTLNNPDFWPIERVEDRTMAAFHTQLLTIQGMEDDDAVHGVSRALGQLPGIRLDSVDVGYARVLAEPGCESLIRDALTGAGFALASTEIEG